MDTTPINSVPCNVDNRCVGSESSGQCLHNDAKNSNEANKKAQDEGELCTALLTVKQQRVNCSTIPTVTAKLLKKKE